MRVHTQGFKDQIKELGREIDSRITFGENVISNEELFSISPVVNASLLKSVMKQLDFESSIQVPLYTVIKYEFGLKVNDTYEYIDFGNYIVYSSEYNEDTKSYEHTCYDSMLFSMKEYETLKSASILGKTFPMSVRDYITCLCADIGLVFKNDNDTFANYDKIIASDLYANLGYTYRDIFDELSQVTASNICIDSNDMVEVRYINDTNDTIDEEYLKDINVKFGEKYGPANSIVLSRSSESDNVYLQNEQSVATNGLCEIKISDNQIMNNNDRSDYLPSILAKLNGLEYYLNDFTSTGIMYYELCDKYNVNIGENTYSCVLFNDEPKITQGLVENIYTERPEESVTDYTKADKTDRKINQTYLIVDKQNQKIQSVVEQTDEQNRKIAKVTQTVEELNSKISDIADITVSGEDNDAQVEFENINQSEPIRIVIRPIGESISYIYPSENLFPSEDLFLKVRTVRFENTKTGEIFDYELPEDLLYYDEENYDEFILDYDGQSCVVNKRVEYNADGTTYVLEKPITNEYKFPKIELTDGDYVVSVLGYENAYLFVRLMAQNIYTTQFATRAEVDSEISQTANSIISNVSAGYATKNELSSATTNLNSKIEQTATSITNTVSSTYETKENAKENYTQLKQTDSSISTEVKKKVGNNEIISKINQSAENVTIDANKISLAGKKINMTSDDIEINAENFKVDADGNLWCNNADVNGKITSESGKIGNFDINSNGLTVTSSFNTNYTDADLERLQSIILGEVQATQADYDRLDIGGNHQFDVFDMVRIQRIKLGADTATQTGKFVLDRTDPVHFLKIIDSNKNTVSVSLGYAGGYINSFGFGTMTSNNEDYSLSSRITSSEMVLKDNVNFNVTSLEASGITTPTLTQTSRKESKKNFEKYNNALDEIQKIDIYKYNLNGEKDETKKHIGFVIGDEYNYSSEITALDKEGNEVGVDLYSMTSLCLQAIKEQQEQIELLKKEIELLKNKESDK